MIERLKNLKKEHSFLENKLKGLSKKRITFLSIGKKIETEREKKKKVLRGKQQSLIGERKKTIQAIEFKWKEIQNLKKKVQKIGIQLESKKKKIKSV